MASAPEGDRPFITTPDDHSGIALATATLLATWMLLCFFLRLFMRFTTSGPFGKDDLVCGIATVSQPTTSISTRLLTSQGTRAGANYRRMCIDQQWIRKEPRPTQRKTD